MQILNIIGGGKVGQTLGKLWVQNNSLQIGDVLCRSLSSAEEAVRFIGEGNALNEIRGCSSANLYMLSVPDDVLESTVSELVAADCVKKGDTVFHCSGSISSSVLESLKAVEARICSVHPLKSFADSGHSVETFSGTYCAIEGDPEACDAVAGLFKGVGAHTFRIHADKKMLYHGASVFVCNYLTALLETGVRLYEEAGLERKAAMKIMEPIVRETVGNVFALGTADALTGPIARGDNLLVEKQLKEVVNWEKSGGELYAQLGMVSLNLARQRGNADSENLEKIEKLFSNSS